MKTLITYVGSAAAELIDSGTLIMFNNTAPQELRNIAVIHDKQSDEKDILHKNGKFVINNKEYNIDFVGKVANKNFNVLGHLSVYFNNKDETGKLPGSIFVSGPVNPNIDDFKQGNLIQII